MKAQCKPFRSMNMFFSSHDMSRQHLVTVPIFQINQAEKLKLKRCMKIYDLNSHMSLETMWVVCQAEQKGSSEMTF